jgi:hypothetical protein
MKEEASRRRKFRLGLKSFVFAAALIHSWEKLRFQTLSEASNAQN